MLESPPYRTIFTERISIEGILKICEIALFVKQKIRTTDKSRRTFEKDADLHFIAALFKIQNKSGSRVGKYSKVHRIIKDTVKALRKKHGQDLTYNKIFTKNENTWKIIEKKLQRIT